MAGAQPDHKFPQVLSMRPLIDCCDLSCDDVLPSQKHIALSAKNPARRASNAFRIDFDNLLALRTHADPPSK
jgi:hypothetical protein